MKYLFKFSIFIFIISGLLQAQDSKFIFLKNADVLSGMTIDGEQVRELSGNVEFSQGNVTLKCNRARQFFKTNKIEVFGNVILIQDTLKLYTDDGIYYGDLGFAECRRKVKLNDGHITLTAQKGFYDVNLRRAYFKENIKIEDPENTIYSDSVVFFRDEKIMYAIKNVRLVSNDRNTIITGDSLQYFQKIKHSKVYSHARLMRIDTSYFKKTDGKMDSISLDTLFLKARLLESKRDSIGQILVATDSVNLYRKELSAKVGKMTYLMKDSIFIFENDPVLWYLNNQVTGDSIRALLKGSTLKEVISINNAFALSVFDTNFNNRFNQISGKILSIIFKERKIDSIISNDQASALYYVLDNERPNGLNKSSGDKIIMIFSIGKILDIKVRSGIEGNYYPENMILGKESTYNLPGFLFRPNRPGRSDF